MEQYSSTLNIDLAQIDKLKANIEALQPISEEQRQRIFQKYRLDWNYHSNSIEGNSLSYGETVAFLMEGLTAKGKPLKDHLDIRGHNEAINFLLELQKREAELTERDIRELHVMILVEPYESRAETADGQATTKIIQLGQYKTSANHVRTATGEVHYYATPEETPAKMHDLMVWYRENKAETHPLILSALFHHRFVSIHPFDDGNGRMARLLSNLILMQAGYPPIVILQSEKREYYGALSQADAGIDTSLLEYFSERLIRSLDTYLKGAKGEDISDSNDLDKEIALFKASFDDEVLARVELTTPVLEVLLIKSILPLLKKVIEYSSKLNNLFLSSGVKVSIHSIATNEGNYIYDEETVDQFIDSWLGGTSPLLLDKFVGVFSKKSTYRTITLNYSWKSFKASTNPLPSFSEMISITFHNAEYVITAGRTTSIGYMLTKFYPKQLTQDEIDAVTRYFVVAVMDTIKRKQNHTSV
ncbi:Fic family protein [Hymenobacter sp. GOD-10R]|uniref:Fic family protein n=1 Tax=Hymenobacter sp. GOD-10R TaxID=3093922 RepID=UPI002D77634D|nr:Fic family protein [Hymenobacter sp. GOD-10R]WRQ29371.1 Fic family protein [Hymenobacter sp. GOD-10R]